MSPFGSRTSAGIPASSASSISTTARPVLPEPVIPTTTPCVVRSLEPTTTRSPPGLPVVGSIAYPRWNEPRSAMRGQSLESSRARPTSRRTRVARRGSQRVTPPTGSALEKHERERRLEELGERIDALQYRLYAEDRRSVLLVLQGLDASGKDGVIRRVFAGVNPIGVEFTSFGVPAGAEVEHDYLWRIHAALPERGRGRGLQPLALRGRRRRADAGACAGGRSGVAATSTSARSSGCSSTRERRSSRCSSTCPARSSARGCRSGSTIPRSAGSSGTTTLRSTSSYDDWVAAWDDALTETSTDWAPWHVVPADRNWVKALAVAELLCATLETARSAAPRARERARGPPIDGVALRRRMCRFGRVQSWTIDSGRRSCNESQCPRFARRATWSCAHRAPLRARRVS